MTRRAASTGFTLLEMVVVLLLLGILAGVAAPKFFSVSESAHETTVRQSLNVVRDAIQLFSATHGKLPGADGDEATFKSDLEPFLRDFPAQPLAPAQNDSVLMTSDTDPPNGESTPTRGWKYYFNTGTFIANLDKPTSSDATVHFDDL